MNILLLRGQFPKDRKNPKEILYNSIEDETDIYTEMAYAMTTERDKTTVLYWGYNRQVKYAPNFEVRFVPSFETYQPEHKPDIIIARGGFKEYLPILKRYHWALKVYYGAGKRAVPSPSFSDYDLILADSKEQVEDIRSVYPYKNIQLWLKPASHIFVPEKRRRKYDLCYVAIHPEDPRKRIKWLYETLPSRYTVLQLGNYPRKHKPPKNVTVKAVRRESMSRAMNKCRVGIAPYTRQDSAPRCVPEMLACGLPVVALRDLRIWERHYPVALVKEAEFWPTVKAALRAVRDGQYMPKYNVTMQSAAKRLRALIDALETE